MTIATATRRQRRMARQPNSDASGAHEAETADTAQPALQERSGTSEPSKTGTVLALLNREGGATLDEMVVATGWLPHSARAALTGLRKKGHAIEPTKFDGVSRYSILGPKSQ